MEHRRAQRVRPFWSAIVFIAPVRVPPLRMQRSSESPAAGPPRCRSSARIVTTQAARAEVNTAGDETSSFTRRERSATHAQVQHLTNRVQGRLTLAQSEDSGQRCARTRCRR
jgi:hypothetical protein